MDILNISDIQKIIYSYLKYSDILNLNCVSKTIPNCILKYLNEQEKIQILEIKNGEKYAALGEIHINQILNITGGDIVFSLKYENSNRLNIKLNHFLIGNLFKKSNIIGLHKFMELNGIYYSTHDYTPLYPSSTFSGMYMINNYINKLNFLKLPSDIKKLIYSDLDYTTILKLKCVSKLMPKYFDNYLIREKTIKVLSNLTIQYFAIGEVCIDRVIKQNKYESDYKLINVKSKDILKMLKYRRKTVPDIGIYCIICNLFKKSNFIGVEKYLCGDIVMLPRVSPEPNPYRKGPIGNSGCYGPSGPSPSVPKKGYRCQRTSKRQRIKHKGR